jgi:hypothetical protein
MEEHRVRSYVYGLLRLIFSPDLYKQIYTTLHETCPYSQEFYNNLSSYEEIEKYAKKYFGIFERPHFVFQNYRIHAILNEELKKFNMVATIKDLVDINTYNYGINSDDIKKLKDINGNPGFPICVDLRCICDKSIEYSENNHIPKNPPTIYQNYCNLYKKDGYQWIVTSSVDENHIACTKSTCNRYPYIHSTHECTQNVK